MAGACTLVGWLVVNNIVVLGLLAMGLLAIEARNVIPDCSQEAFVLQVTSPLVMSARPDKERLLLRIGSSLVWIVDLHTQASLMLLSASQSRL